jgi:hypothetical protein
VDTLDKYPLSSRYELQNFSGSSSSVLVLKKPKLLSAFWRNFYSFSNIIYFLLNPLLLEFVRQMFGSSIYNCRVFNTKSSLFLDDYYIHEKNEIDKLIPLIENIIGNNNGGNNFKSFFNDYEKLMLSYSVKTSTFVPNNSFNNKKVNSENEHVFHVLQSESSIYYNSLFDTYILEENCGDNPNYSFFTPRALFGEIRNGFNHLTNNAFMSNDPYLLFSRANMLYIEAWLKMGSFQMFSTKEFNEASLSYSYRLLLDFGNVLNFSSNQNLPQNLPDNSNLNLNSNTFFDKNIISPSMLEIDNICDFCGSKCNLFLCLWCERVLCNKCNLSHGWASSSFFNELCNHSIDDSGNIYRNSLECLYSESYPDYLTYPFPSFTKFIPYTIPSTPYFPRTMKDTCFRCMNLVGILWRIIPRITYAFFTYLMQAMFLISYPLWKLGKEVGKILINNSLDVGRKYVNENLNSLFGRKLFFLHKFESDKNEKMVCEKKLLVDHFPEDIHFRNSLDNEKSSLDNNNFSFSRNNIYSYIPEGDYNVSIWPSADFLFDVPSSSSYYDSRIPNSFVSKYYTISNLPKYPSSYSYTLPPVQSLLSPLDFSISPSVDINFDYDLNKNSLPKYNYWSSENNIPELKFSILLSHSSFLSSVILFSPKYNFGFENSSLSNFSSKLLSNLNVKINDFDSESDGSPKSMFSNESDSSVSFDEKSLIENLNISLIRKSSVPFIIKIQSILSVRSEEDIYLSSPFLIKDIFIKEKEIIIIFEYVFCRAIQITISPLSESELLPSIFFKRIQVFGRTSIPQPVISSIFSLPSIFYGPILIPSSSTSSISVSPKKNENIEKIPFFKDYFSFVTYTFPHQLNSCFSLEGTKSLSSWRSYLSDKSFLLQNNKKSKNKNKYIFSPYVSSFLSFSSSLRDDITKNDYDLLQSILYSMVPNVYFKISKYRYEAKDPRIALEYTPSAMPFAASNSETMCYNKMVPYPYDSPMRFLFDSIQNVSGVILRVRSPKK